MLGIDERRFGKYTSTKGYTKDSGTEQEQPPLETKLDDHDGSRSVGRAAWFSAPDRKRGEAGTTGCPSAALRDIGGSKNKLVRYSQGQSPL